MWKYGEKRGSRRKRERERETRPGPLLLSTLSILPTVQPSAGLSASLPWTKRILRKRKEEEPGPEPEPEPEEENSFSISPSSKTSANYSRH